VEAPETSSASLDDVFDEDGEKMDASCEGYDHPEDNDWAENFMSAQGNRHYHVAMDNHDADYNDLSVFCF
jgi:hypothetical protein